MPLVNTLPKDRVQVAIQMGLDAVLTQLAIDGGGAPPVNLAPKWNAGMQNGAQGMMTVC